MSYFKVLTQGQTLVVAITNNAGTAVTTYTTSARSTSHTLPLTITSDTEFHFAPGSDYAPHILTVSQLDGTVLYGPATVEAHPSKPHIIGPEPTGPQLAVDAADTIGIVSTAGVDTVGTGLVTVGAANRCLYQRIVAGSGSISKIGLLVGVSSGNIAVAVFRSTGSGVSALPGTRIATSGSVACPTGSAYAEVALDGTVSVGPGDWLALAADNTTATFAGFANPGSALMGGRQCYEASAFPPPASATTPTAGGRTLCLLGIE